MAKIVMFWNCTYCKKTKIPGYNFSCPGCGAPRNKVTKFYHSDPVTYATPAETKLFDKGDPNWYCEGDGVGNLQKHTKCRTCGAPRTQKSEVGVKRDGYKLNDLPHSEEEAERTDPKKRVVPVPQWKPDMNDPYNPQTVDEPDKSVDEDRSVPVWPVVSDHSTPISETVSQYFNEDTLPVIKKVGVGLSALAILMFVGLLTYNFFFKLHTETVQVSAMPWTQSVRIEEYQTVHEQGWSIPEEYPGFSSAGRETGMEMRKSGDLKVHDGWTTETVPDTCYKDVEVPDTCTRYTMQPDTCYDTRQVSATCTGSEYVSDTCYTNNGDGSSDSYECGGYESYTYSCTESESYSYSCETSQPEQYACTKWESQPYACTKVIDVELYHYEDIMSPWYWYDLERWNTIGTYPTSGNGPDVFYDPIQPNGVNQRRIEEGGTYFVTFSATKEGSKVQPFTNEYDLAGFLYFFLGQLHEVDVNRQGQVFELR